MKTEQDYKFKESEHYWNNNHDRGLDVLFGRVISRIEETGDQIIFVMEDGMEYRMCHHQDCCESVVIESIVGDLNDLIGTPITLSEEGSGYTPPDDIERDSWESHTWTFYKFATIKGYVDVRWLGTSNGYYSESVSFERIK